MQKIYEESVSNKIAAFLQFFKGVFRVISRMAKWPLEGFWIGLWVGLGGFRWFLSASGVALEGLWVVPGGSG